LDCGFSLLPGLLFALKIIKVGALIEQEAEELKQREGAK